MNKYLTEYEFKKLQKIRSSFNRDRLSNYVDILKKRYEARSLDLVTGELETYDEEEEEE